MENKPKNKRYSRQQIKKHYDGKCFVCGESKYELLDAHRIIEGGTYHSCNVITLCTLHHRLTHTGEIRFDKKYLSTKGCYILHWWLNDHEMWTPC